MSKTNDKTNPISDLPADEFTGMGGSYMLDPNTGKRTLVTRTKSLAEADAEAKVAEATEAPADKASEPLATQLIAAIAAELAEPATPQRKK